MIGPRPAAPARWLLGVAVLALPSGAVRDRYREEFRTELCQLGGAGQVRQAASLCRGAVALRHAVADPDLPVASSARRTLRCRLGRHTFVARRDDNPERKGRPYHVCVRCGEWYESKEPEVDIDKLGRTSPFPHGGIM